MGVQGFDALINKLKAMAAPQKSAVCVVGFQTNYAIHVHEDLEMEHPNGGQAKYLEEPARALRPQFGAMARDLAAQGVPLEKILAIIGLRLQREAQLLVPVDTGLLKASAFTLME